MSKLLEHLDEDACAFVVAVGGVFLAICAGVGLILLADGVRKWLSNL